MDREQVTAGEVRFTGTRQAPRRFETTGDTWAIVAPATDVDGIFDLGAFAFDDPERRATLHGDAFAVGLDNASWVARLHPKRHIPVSFTVWDWLAGNCQSVLPVDWRRFAQWLNHEGFPGVTASNDEEAARIDARIKFALRAPRLYVRKGGRW